MVVNEKSKRNKIVIIAFLITAILATTITSVLAFGETKEGYRTITVIEIQGTVGVVRNNMEYAAYTGMHLEEGYTIVTGGNSYIRLLLDDDKYVKLEAGTRAIFSAVSGGKTAIDIERGALVAEVTKPLQVDEDFVINTPNAVLAVRGTLFRVDLSRNDKGELNTDVMTYGGAVSSKRVQPNGDVDNVEVTVKEGFKATVNMDDKETVYLVDEVKVDLSALVGSPSGDNKPDDTTTLTNANGETVTQPALTLESVLMPIVVEDIPDDDLVDIYFAAENGHSMFIETKEIKTKIEERNIDISEKTPVYEVAKNVIKPVEIVIPDDNKPLLITTEVKTEQVVAVQGTPNDGVGDETTTEVTTETITELVITEPTTVVIITVPTTTVPTTTVPTTTVPTTTVPTTTVPTTTVPTTTVPTTTVPTTTVPTTTVPTTTVSTTIVPTTESTTVTTTEQTTEPTTEITTEPTTEEITVHIHTEIIEEIKATCTENGLKTVKCSTCGEIISETVLTATGHTEKTNTVDATCTESGKKTVTCSICGELISESVLQATGHTEILSGTKDAHTECSVCYEILSDKHNYQTSRTEPSCTLDGGTTYVCECGYNYTETIPATGHTEVAGKGSDIHTLCLVCGETVKDGTYHDYTDEIIPNSCTTNGTLTHTCSCGWNYTEEIPASHTKADSTLSVTECSACGGDWVDLTSENFPDSMFLSYVSSEFNTDTKVGDVALIGEELTGVTTINVAGDSTTDGGYTNLKGIDKFINLTTLNCAYNSGITSLDLSGLTKLESLNITGLTNLEMLNISGTNIASLDITGLTNLKSLNVSGCEKLSTITGLDTCTELTELNVSNTRVATLNLDANKNVETVNLSNCSALTSFVINEGSASSGYALSSIDLTACTSLETLTINNCFNLTTVDFTDLTALKTIDLGGCQGVTGTLDVSGKTALTSLVIGATKFTSLNVTGCTALATIDTAGCSNLTSINITSCTALTSLNARISTSLTNIVGTSSCTNLASLVLVGTGVTSLDLEANTNLETLNVMNCTSLTNLNLTRTTPSTTFDSLTVTGCAALTNLNLYNCLGITSLVTTPLTALKELNLSYSGVKKFNGVADTMDFSDNTKLINLYLNGITSFTSFDVSANTSLEEFSLSQNERVTSLDFTGKTNLKILSLSDVDSLNTLKIDDCSGLERLSILNTSLVSIEVKNKPGIEDLQIYGNNLLETLEIDGCNSLKDKIIKFSSGPSFTNPALTTLIINNCNIDFLDITYLTAIKSLTVTNCPALTSITGLEELKNLTNLVTNGSGINSLVLNGNTQLSYLDVSNATSLAILNISGTKLTTVYGLSSCSGLKTFNMDSIETEYTFSIANSYVETISAKNIKVKGLSITGSRLKYLDVTESEIGDGGTVAFSLNEAASSLETLIISRSNISVLPYDNFTSLKTFEAVDCDKLTGINATISNIEEINISGCSLISTGINFSQYTSLKSLNVSNTEFTSLDFSANSALKSLDVSYCSKLNTLNLVGANDLESLNVTNAGKSDDISSFTITYVVSSQTANVVGLATGWDESYMVSNPVIG